MSVLIRRDLGRTLRRTALGILLAASPAGAADGEFLTRAKVLSSSPIVETVYEQYEECSRRAVSRRDSRKQYGRGSNLDEALIVGILGGAAGSAIGKGSGRDAAAGAGAVLGSSLAGDGEISEGEVIGGIVGGIVGNQIGKGGGKTAATGVGALVGSIVGDELQHGGQRQAAAAQTRRVCEVKERPKKIITGYEVTYEYSGVRQTGVLPYEPGDHVDINVGVSLVENRAGSAR